MQPLPQEHLGQVPYANDAIDRYINGGPCVSLLNKVCFHQLLLNMENMKESSNNRKDTNIK